MESFIHHLSELKSSLSRYSYHYGIGWDRSVSAKLPTTSLGQCSHYFVLVQRHWMFVGSVSLSMYEYDHKI